MKIIFITVFKVFLLQIAVEKSDVILSPNNLYVTCLFSFVENYRIFSLFSWSEFHEAVPWFGSIIFVTFFSFFSLTILVS